MITIEMIDEFRRRTNASYDDARYYLERHGGDMLEAVIDFEKARNSGNSGNNQRCQGNFGRGIARFIQRLFDIKVTITDRTERTMHVPAIIPVLLFPVWHILILLAIVMMIMGFRFGVREIKDDNINVESVFNRVRERVRAGRHC